MDISDDNHKKNNHVAVFENIGFISGLIVYIDLLLGYDVRYFRCNTSAEKMRFFRKYSGNNRLRQVIPGEIDLDAQTKLNNEVIDSIDGVYTRYFAGRGFIRTAEDNLKSDGIHAVYKKTISLKMLEQYQIFQRLESIAGNYAAPVYYYPEDNFYKEPYVRNKIKNIAGTKKIIIPITGKLLALLSELQERIHWLLIYVFFPIWILLQAGHSGKKDLQKTDYKLGIRIYANDYAFDPKYRSIDFLIGGNCPLRKDTLFCVETDIPPVYKDTLQEKGCTFVEIRKILETMDLFSLGKCVITDLVPLWCRSIGSLLSQRSYVTRLFIETQHKRILWTVFLQKFSLKHYVTYNDTISGDTIRNILMSDAGTETWYFIHSIDNFDHYTPQSEGKLYREVLYSFLYFDHIVVWGDNSEQFYRSCPNYFRHFDKLGCLWSEHISQVIRYPEKNDVLRSIQQHFSEKNGKVPEKIIGVFDTTAGGAQMPLQMQDIESFIDGILHILSKYPDVGVVFKIKNPFEYNERYFPEIIEIYKRLIGHPRCYPINATRSRAQSDPSEVTAISDLVISACFTSITVEALGARKRAMYYDATGKFRNLYFDRFPRFVAHDLDQLDDLVQYWLYQCPEEEFSDFLDKHIKGELESYIDGKAITRFRERICR